ncbi:MAG: thioredoxin [Clostridia bacterium]|nr:thioredoxin [Clostridia bacterium]
MAEPTVLTKENFDGFIRDHHLVLVDFWASWCQPCRMIAPHVEKAAEAYEGKVHVGKLNIEEEADIATRQQVMSIPALFLYRDGKRIDKTIGFNPKALLEMLDRAVSRDE